MKKILIYIFAFLPIMDVVAQNKGLQTIVDFKFSNDFVFGTTAYLWEYA